MNFSEALEHLKAGKKIYRHAWSTRWPGNYVYYVNSRIGAHNAENELLGCRYNTLFTEEDVLADDWKLVQEVAEEENMGNMIFGSLADDY